MGKNICDFFFLTNGKINEIDVNKCAEVIYKIIDALKKIHKKLNCFCRYNCCLLNVVITI